MVNDGNSSILSILQKLKLAMEQDVNDRKNWLQEFTEESRREAFLPGESTEQKGATIPENGATKTRKKNEILNKTPETEVKERKSAFLENIPVEINAEACPEKSKILTNKQSVEKSLSFSNAPTKSSSINSQVGSGSVLVEPINNTIPPPSISSPPPKNAIGAVSITKTAVPPPPPPPPLPTEENMKVSPTKPKGPIKLTACHENNEFFLKISSKFEPEKFTIPKIDSSLSPKNNLANSAGSVDKQRSAVIDSIKEEGMKKQIGLSAQEMYKAITTFDYENLNYDAIEILLQNARNDKTTHPGTKEQTLSYRNVLDTIEDGKQILKSMLYFKSFLSEYKRLEGQFAKMKQVCESLEKSAKQPKFCQLVRNIIEFVNAANGDNRYLTNGFEIKTLSTLWETKPFNGRSAMNIFVENLVRNNSETLSFYEDFDYLTGFCCPDPVTVGKDLTNLSDRLKLAKAVVDKLSKDQKDNNIDHILKSIPDMENKIQVLEKEWEATTKLYSVCLKAYGQTGAEKEPTFLLVEVLQNFIKEFEKEKQIHEAQNKKVNTENDSPKENKIPKYSTLKKSPLKSNNNLPPPPLSPETSELEKALYFTSTNQISTGPRRRRRQQPTENRDRERISKNTYIR